MICPHKEGFDCCATAAIIIDVATCELTLSQVLAKVHSYKAAHPERNIWLDGDMHAIVAEVVA